MRTTSAVAVMAVLILACEDPQASLGPHNPPPDEGHASTPVMNLVEGQRQFGIVGQALPKPLAVRITTNGRPIAGEQVSFTIISGGGFLERQLSITDSDGVATSGSWTLGHTDAPQEVEARSGKLRFNFMAQGCEPSRCDLLLYVRDGNIHLVNLVTGDSKRLTSNGRNAHPTWSPDGKRIAFAHYDQHWNADIYVMNGDGSSVVRRTYGLNLSFPAWSADGRSLVAATALLPYSGTVYMMTADGSEDPLRLFETASMPSLSSDGKSIAFVSLSGDDGYNALHIADIDGRNLRVLSPRDEGVIYSPSWSPDGKTIAFSKCMSGGCAIIVMDSIGKPIMHMQADGSMGSPSWTSDGKFLAVTLRPIAGGPTSIAYLDLSGKVLPAIIMESGDDPRWHPGVNASD